MKRTSTKMIGLFLAICMALALTACGGTEPSQGTATNQPSEPPAPETLVDPEEIEWGYEAPGSSDTQYWYPDGDKLSDYYLMFEDGYLTIIDGDNRTTFDTAVEDGHIVNYDDEAPDIDFVFPDILTWEQWNITFYEDGTYSYNCDGNLMEGDWWLSDARTIEYNDDYGTAWFQITYDDASWEVISIRDTESFYPES